MNKKYNFFNKIFHIIGLFALMMIISHHVLYAQVEMANRFRSEGKIYVVILIFLVILAGFFILLFRVDKRSKNLEKTISNKNK